MQKPLIQQGQRLFHLPKPAGWFATAGKYLKSSRHGTLFYFRRRMPDDLRSLIDKHYPVKSLGTEERREAIIRARVLAAQTDCIKA